MPVSDAANTPAKVVIERHPDAGWDRAVLAGSSGSLSLFHTTAWADRVRELVGGTPLYCAVQREGVVRLRLVAFDETARAGSGGGVRRLASAVRARLQRKGFRWYGQPVEGERAELADYAALASSLRAHVRRDGRKLVGGEWPLKHEGAIPREWKQARWATLKIALERPIDAIHASLKHSARKEIRKTLERGVVVRRVESEAELARYVEEAKLCAARRGNASLRTDDFLTMWKYFRRPGFHFETFGAWQDERFIAGLSVWGAGRTVGELGSFQSEYAFEEKISGPDLVKWNAIEWAASQGLATFDLAGINPAPTTEKERNIRRFKEKWGGVLEEYLTLTE